MDRLHPDTLAAAAPDVRLPAYDHTGVRPGILHLGVGAFHRAHQAVFTDDALAVAGGDWGIIGVSLRSPAVAAQLNPQAGLYSVCSESAGGRELRVIGALAEVLVAPQEPARVIAAIARDSIRIITLTITEKGYALAPDGRSLDRDNPVIAADLATPERPASALGLLALGLNERMRAGGAALTVLSCDNLAENSSRLHGVLSQYLAETFPAVLPWLERSVSFPCSMVDRIVPAMTDAQRERQSGALGLVDEGAVHTEQFNQWIIEDRFAAGRPAWERAGAQFVANILPFENMKLRLLNASHSAIAYCGLLAGWETVADVMARPALRHFVEALMRDDLVPALTAPPGFDLAAYRDDLLARFDNPHLEHRCAQIAMDGSEKISQRWLPTLAAAPSPLLRRALAAWCHVVLGTCIEIDDPRRDALLAARQDTGTPAQRLAAVLACARIDAATVADFDALLAGLECDMTVIAQDGIERLLTVELAA